jgi:hypothetical protein
MKASVLVLLLVAAAVTGGAMSAATAEPATLPDETSLREADNAQLLAARNRNADALDAMMAPAFIVNSPEGEIWPRARVLAMWRNRGIGHDHFERFVESVVLSRNVGIVAGRELVQPSADSVAGKRRHDGGVRVTRRFTNVWLWENGRWWFFARHANEATASAATH